MTRGTRNRPLSHKGYYYDVETKFYYLQSRYYDPRIGRFINADGYASTGQGILGSNMFAYCGNEPVGNSDPSGCYESANEEEKELVRMILGISLYAGLGFAALQSDVGPKASSNGGALGFSSEKYDTHHILHGTRNRHEEEWNRFGIDPNDPDDKNWLKLLPILEETIRNGKEVHREIIRQTGDTLIYFRNMFEEFSASVVVKIWESSDASIQKISDAWADLF